MYAIRSYYGRPTSSTAPTTRSARGSAAAIACGSLASGRSAALAGGAVSRAFAGGLSSLRLIRLTLFGLLLAALYWVWADLISVVTYLDNITLYEFSYNFV